MKASHQTGAALVVALILLIALSLLAISSINTATLDLIMAGNEQYRARAFAAAEAGLAIALTEGDFNDTSSKSSDFEDDSFTYTITKPNNGIIDSIPIGSSADSFGGVYYQITSTGTSEKSATSTVIQELYQVVPKKSGIEYQNICGDISLGSSCPTP